jgi:hypothetical protein
VAAGFRTARFKLAERMSPLDWWATLQVTACRACQDPAQVHPGGGYVPHGESLRPGGTTQPRARYTWHAGASVSHNRTRSSRMPLGYTTGPPARASTHGHRRESRLLPPATAAARSGILSGSGLGVTPEVTGALKALAAHHFLCVFDELV